MKRANGEQQQQQSSEEKRRGCRQIIPRWLFSSGIFDARERPYDAEWNHIRDGDNRLDPKYRYTPHGDDGTTMLFYNNSLCRDFVGNKLDLIFDLRNNIEWEGKLMSFVKDANWRQQFTTDKWLLAIKESKRRHDQAKRDELFATWAISKLVKKVLL